MYLDHCIGDMDLDNSEVVLSGDFNVDYSTKKNPLRRKLDEFASKQLKLFVKPPVLLRVQALQ